MSVSVSLEHRLPWSDLRGSMIGKKTLVVKLRVRRIKGGGPRRSKISLGNYALED